jgi:Flp pilus assembly pilin Flp
MKRTFARLRALRKLNRKGEAGQGLAEYALILVLIAIVCVAALQTLGVAIANSPGFTDLPGAL